MTKSNNEWVPDVGTECEAFVYYGQTQLWMECEVLKLHNGQPAVFVKHGSFLAWADECRPIKTEAEKRRDEQVAFMNEVCLEFHSNKQIGLSIGHCLYEAGVRVPSENEFIATKLTDEDLSEILNSRTSQGLNIARHVFIETQKRMGAPE